MAPSEETLDNHSGQDGQTERPLMERALPGIRSKYMATERKAWTKMIVMFLVLLTVIVLGILSLYWGADHSLQFNVPVFTVAVIDFDGGEVGPYLQQMAAMERAMNPKMTLGYVNEPGSKYNFSNEMARHALYEEKFWIGLVVQANATTAMNYAYNTGNTSYDPSGSIHLIYEEGRNALAIDEYAYPLIVTFMTDFVMKFTKQKQMSLLTANAGNAAALARQAQTPIPIGYSTYNLAPYVPSTAEAATEIGTIYLIIISFVSVLMFDALNQAMMGKVPMVRYYIFRMLTLPVLYLFLSLCYLALSCMWQIRFDKYYGASGYVIYWMLSWVSMMAFGLTVENVNNVLGPPFTPVFFIFWVISNVATGFYPVELLSNFYDWGLAWPLRHDIIAGKAILFGTKNELGLNFGVIIAWVAIGLALQPLTIWVQMRKNKSMVDAHRREVLERMYKPESGENKKD